MSINYHKISCGLTWHVIEFSGLDCYRNFQYPGDIVTVDCDFI
jgi:hypothetical protein